MNQVRINKKTLEPKVTSSLSEFISPVFGIWANPITEMSGNLTNKNAGWSRNEAQVAVACPKHTYSPGALQNQSEFDFPAFII